jgi:hypothetical protein
MTNKRKKTVKTPSLSSENVKTFNGMSDSEIKELEEKVFTAVNNLELQKSIEKWSKEKNNKTKVSERDLTILKNHIIEYMDSFLLFGYTFDGERIIMQHFDKPKDRDAMMEFLKIVFYNQQQDNFLDE